MDKYNQDTDLYIAEFEELCPIHNPIFKNREMLSEDFEPTRLVGRDLQKKEIMSTLQPITEESSPINLYIHGKHGVGKTHTTQYIFKIFNMGIKAKLEDNIVKFVSVNCGINKDNIEVCKTLFRQFGIDSNPRGFSLSANMDHIWNYVNDMGRKHKFFTVVFFFDEIDMLNSNKRKKTEYADLEILYNITRAIEAKQIKYSNCKVGLILASNKKNFFAKIDPSITTTGKFYRYEFPNYNEEELFQIIMDRIEAFNPNVIEPEFIRYVAKDIAERYRGDARRALDVLLVAGKLALDENSKTITVEHLLQADKRINQLKLEKEIMDFSLHERLLLITLDLCNNFISEPTTGLVHEVYRWVCFCIGKAPVSKTETSRTLTEWVDQYDLIETTKGYKGNTRIIHLTDDTKQAVQILYNTDIKKALESKILDLESDIELYGLKYKCHDFSKKCV